jgi:Domain of unknown function (DUF1707)
MTDRPIRASDQERESVVGVLRDAFTDGRLTFDEFEERTAAAYAARTWTDLRGLTSDLPAQWWPGGTIPPGAPGEALAGVGLNQRLQDAPVPPGSPALPHRRVRRVRPFDRLLPVLLVWILISAAAGSPDIAAALSFVFICVLAVRIAHGGRG